MQTWFIEYVFLIMTILALVMLAGKLRIAYPIVLVLGGLALSFVPVFPHMVIAPDLVFFIFLPPLLYEASWQVSWKEFWRWRRVITSFAFPIVIITAVAIAWFSHWLIPGFTLALGFLLGGIVSPPDAVSATSVMRGVSVPRSLISILEGESLLNDASSLIVFRFALAAVLTGQFHLGEASLTFLLVVVLGIVVGLAVGLFFYAIHRWLPTNSNIEIVLTLVTPYCMYFAAERLHCSGVLAVVSGGLLLSSKRQTMLTYRSRLEGVNVWSNLVFVLNGLVFLLIGLQLPAITGQLGEVQFVTALRYGLLISLALIIVRFACTFGAALFTRIMSRFITVADPNPGWKAPLISGWAGMRGVVSLAAALSIPVVTSQDQPFPFRNLILFITFIVILITLVVQGLTLPWLIRMVHMKDRFSPYPRRQQELIIQKKIAQVSREFLEERYPGKSFPTEHIANLHTRLSLDQKALEEQLQEPPHPDNTWKGYTSVYLDMLDRQRSLLTGINRHSELDEELIRKYLSVIDLEEFRLRL